MTLTMAQAYQILAIATRRRPKRLNVKISIVILDAWRPQAAGRLDGAPWHWRIFFARGRRSASAMNDMSSADLAGDRLGDHPGADA
jgi:hypothetical protein